jgi:hypothetical protein
LINITNLTYPPFGIVGIPYVALSSVLIFIGIYSSAVWRILAPYLINIKKGSADGALTQSEIG